MFGRTRPTTSGKSRFSALRLGIGFIAVAVIAGVALFAKDRIATTLRPGTTITIDFAQDYKLQPYSSQAKISGVPVGMVTGVDLAPDGSSIVHLKVDRDVPAKLRSVPSAVIRPTTLLGGQYYIDLVPGGERTPFDGEIPRNRTGLPVELDKIVDALPPDTLAATQHTLGELDGTLDDRGRSALDRLLADAPGTLAPASDVLQAARGTRQDTDLNGLVTGLESTAATLTAQQGQLTSIMDNLSTASTVLGNRSGDLSATLADLPSTLDTTKAGLTRLDGTVKKLGDTAGPALPVAQRLTVLLQHTDPVLVKARPMVANLTGLLGDARPLVQDLVPATRQLTSVLDDVRGPVLDRVNGPITQTVLSPYRGTGIYQGSGGDKPFYQELGYMLADADRASSMTDANGASIAFEPGIAPGSVGGLPISLEQLFSNLTQIGQHEEGR